MSKVIRVSDNSLMDLDFFKSHFLIGLEKEMKKHKDSNFLKSLYQEKQEYTEAEWISFAIRFAANHVDD